VFKGTLNGSKTVAVKTVHKFPTKKIFTALLTEIKIMIYVGYHPNIVEFVGAMTRNFKQRKISFNMPIIINKTNAAGILFQWKRSQLLSFASKEICILFWTLFMGVTLFPAIFTRTFWTKMLETCTLILFPTN